MTYSSSSSRFSSLDVFRGIAIAGMLLVNKSGLVKEAYPQLQHADWHGWTLADLVFPFFLVCSGGINGLFSWPDIQLP